MNPTDHETDEQCADLELIADQDDTSDEGLQFTAEEIRQLRAEGERRRIEDLKKEPPHLANDSAFLYEKKTPLGSLRYKTLSSSVQVRWSDAVPVGTPVEQNGA